MFPEITKKHFWGFIALSLIMLMAGCDLYKSDVTEIGGVDKTVCQQFSDSVFAELQTQVSTAYDEDWRDSEVSAFAGQLIDSLLEDSIFIEKDYELAYQLTLASAEDTSYVVIKTASSGTIVFTTDIIILHLYDSAGKEYKLNDNEMPLETISGCVQADENNVNQPLIKMRELYSTSAGNILLQLIKAEQTKRTVFKISVQ
ncbi:MAG TPA: hypothetical protein EYP36_11290 [Calditrichaeota bacterium]|nr:hypothetical protein [Calditrichota bacterium]